jgi:hypothetical protein
LVRALGILRRDLLSSSNRFQRFEEVRALNDVECEKEMLDRDVSSSSALASSDALSRPGGGRDCGC